MTCSVSPQGKRVAVLSRNSAQMLVLHFACVRTGAIFVPLNWRLAPAEISFMVADCEPTVIVLEPMFEDRLEQNTIPRLSFDDSKTGFAARMAAAPKPTAPGRGVAVDAEAPITLLYSSGTTGKPKGVIVTQLNAFSGALNLALGTACSPQCHVPVRYADVPHRRPVRRCARAAARGRNGAHQSEVRRARDVLAPRGSESSASRTTSASRRWR